MVLFRLQKTLSTQCNFKTQALPCLLKVLPSFYHLGHFLQPISPKTLLTVKTPSKSGMVGHSYNPSTLKVGAEGSRVQGQPGIPSKTILTKTSTQKQLLQKLCVWLKCSDALSKFLAEAGQETDFPTSGLNRPWLSKSVSFRFYQDNKHMVVIDYILLSSGKLQPQI